VPVGVRLTPASVGSLPFSWPRAWERALGWRAVTVLVAAGAFGCGSSASDASSLGSGGASQAGSSSGGTVSVGHGGAGGAGGTRDEGAGGIVETCLVCGGFGGVTVHFGSAGSGGVSGGAGAGAGGSVGGLTCGQATCGPNQYCRAACTGFGGAQPGNPSCADMPAACNGVSGCACICGVTASFCTPGAHEVQCGCG